MMAPKPANDLLADLERVLPRLGVQAAKDLPVPGNQPIYLRAPVLRLADHFDLKVDLLIYDPSLGTLALVHAVEAQDVQATVEKHVDQATYVRHLLLSESSDKGALPLTVELVLVTRPDTLTDIGAILREVARRTSFLFGIGINVLVAREGTEPYTEHDLRRAFPWLLQATQKWYREGAPEESLAGGTPAKPFQSLTLKGYRLPGQRKLQLLSGSRIHIVYGRNGSGKSSIVEALELAVTGAVERLAGEEDYDRVIRSHGAAEPAQVILGFEGSQSESFVIGSERPAGLSPALKATSFRLDQQLMDRLTRGGDAQRADVFLASFFPADGGVYSRYEAARLQAAKALDDLPPDIKQEIETARGSGQDPEEVVLQKLGWLGEPQKALSPETAAACLPLPLETLLNLGPLSSELAQLAQEWTTSLRTPETAPERLAKVDEMLGGLRGSSAATLGTLRMAKEVLERVGAWIATGEAVSGEDFAAILNSWLELSALVDLGERHSQVLRTLSEARNQAWNVAREGLVGPFAQETLSGVEVEAAKAQSDEWARQRDACFRAVMSSDSQAQARAGQAPRVARPAKPQID
ncbi:MAG TPA: AAA family ATPase, partial [Thermoanaerobaculia bacterium]|nr:AAA family ATPase [Thermoanaerobaculia bacterium]